MKDESNETESSPLSSFFEFCMRMSLSVGGDTDTNVCIVGFTIGAFVGLKNIPT